LAGIQSGLQTEKESNKDERKFNTSYTHRGLIKKKINKYHRSYVTRMHNRYGNKMQACTNLAGQTLLAKF